MTLSGKATKPSATAKSSRPVTRKHLAAALAAEHQLTKRAGEALLGDLVAIITKHLKKGEPVRLSGLGILQVRKRAARMGRNPATGEAIEIKGKQESRFPGGQRFEDGSLWLPLDAQEWPNGIDPNRTMQSNSRLLSDKLTGPARPADRLRQWLSAPCHRIEFGSQTHRRWEAPMRPAYALR